MSAFPQTSRTYHRRAAVLLSWAAAFILLFALVQSMMAQVGEVDSSPEGTAPDELLAPLAEPDLEGSSKGVDAEEALAGSVLEYTIVISNSGTASASAVVTDELPLGLTYVDGSLYVPLSGGPLYGASGNVITWTGSLNGGVQLAITFGAELTTTLAAGERVTNTVEITGAGILITRTATTLVISETVSPFTYLPLIFRNYPPVPTLYAVDGPNSSNAWTVSWSDAGPKVTGYELQESSDPNFASFTTFDMETALSKSIIKSLSPDNKYYYRVRAIGAWGNGPWSNVQSVVGGYYDGFGGTSTDWAVRRMSYLEKTDAKLLTGDLAGNLGVLVFDAWDWLVASPLAEAPRLPYAIEYRSKVHDDGNLVSHGAVFGGDWNGGACPEIGNVYQTDNCFNHFYDQNIIFYGQLKLLFERVDYLYYCPNCGGSQLKRLSYDYGAWFEVDPIPNVDPDGWNTWRVEVRSTGTRMYVNNQFLKETSDPTWVNDPYFGILATTDEYEPSIWLIDYYKVSSLDS